ncbi:hypothetical protein [Bacillus sp. M6-12]|uniref:hypothetical protein n=1 Tax=Bacillus sp. M6-12 TaxID=2054166 RepID=UPI001158ED57|nr:hypothetical protein [Bacillus sp. M6-12]
MDKFFRSMSSSDSNDKNENLENTKNNSAIGHSGNSNVDVHVSVEVDTRPIAYAMLCALLASNQLSNQQFETAVKKWEDLSDSKKKKSNDDKSDSSSKVRLFGQARREAR